MKYGEAIVGLTEGIEDHDHERLVASLAASEALGLAPRLVSQSQLAREEVKRLEEGMVFERAIQAELAVGHSRYGGSSSWDHSSISTAKLQTALDGGVAYPLVSRSGLRLCACARAALAIRPLLAAENWPALVSVPRGDRTHQPCPPSM